MTVGQPSTPIAVFRAAWRRWTDAGATRPAAALSFYALFAVPPTLLAVLRLTSLIVGSDTAGAELESSLSVLATPDVAQTLAQWVDGVELGHGDWLATTFGIVVTAWAAFRGFMHLQGALNDLWGVRPTRGPGLGEMVRRKAVAFGSVALCCAAVIVSFTGTLALRVFARGAGTVPEAWWTAWWANELLALTLSVVCLSMVYRTLPDAVLPMRDTLVGALLSAVALSVGRHAALWGFGGHVPTDFGGAGSLVVVLLFTYYAANLVLLGAAFTWVLAARRGARLRLRPDAVPVRRVDQPA